MEAIGPLQLRVMHFIWDNGSSTVHDVPSPQPRSRCPTVGLHHYLDRDAQPGSPQNLEPKA